MITIKTNIRLLLVITICVLLFSCSHDLSSSGDFLIRVDSINVPDTVISGAPFSIVFFGTIGFDECVAFKTFSQASKDFNITIEAWGTYNDNGGMCKETLVSIDGQKLLMTILIPGNYTILIKEPGNLSLNKHLIVNLII